MHALLMHSPLCMHALVARIDLCIVCATDDVSYNDGDWEAAVPSRFLRTACTRTAEPPRELPAANPHPYPHPHNHPQSDRDPHPRPSANHNTNAGLPIPTPAALSGVAVGLAPSRVWADGMAEVAEMLQQWHLDVYIERSTCAGPQPHHN